MYIVNTEMIYDCNYFICVKVSEVESSCFDEEHWWRIEADAVNGKTYMLLQGLTNEQAVEAIRIYRSGIKKGVKSINFERVYQTIKKIK